MIIDATFGTAIEAVKQGLRIQRKGWNGKNMFVFMRPEDTLEIEFIVEKVKSLPQSVKNFYKGNNHDGNPIKFTSYLCMRAADGTIVNGWLASQTDILAEDWIILD